MEQLTVGASANLIDNCGLQVDHHAPRDVLPSPCFREKSIEGIVTTTNSFIAGHLAIRLDAVFQAERDLQREQPNKGLNPESPQEGTL